MMPTTNTLSMATARACGALLARCAVLVVATLVAASCSGEKSPRPAPESGGGGKGRPAPVAAEKRPDVLMIVVDSLRADRIGLLGNERDLTPNMDGMMRASVRSLFCYSPSPHTAPSLMTLLTGLTPAAHGVRNIDAGGVWVLDTARPTIFEILDHAGWSTMFVNEGGQVRPESGFDRGVDAFLTSGGLEGSIESLSRVLPGIKKDTPLFAVVHTYAAHTPFLPPRELDQIQFRGRFTDREGGGQFKARADALANFTGNKRGKEYADLAQGFLEPYEGCTSDDIAWLNDLYDENVAYVDYQIGLLIEVWKEQRGWDDTILVLTSCHGIALGEGGRFGTVSGLDGAMTRVPWSISGSGVAPGVLTAATGLAPTAPTLLELLGARVTPDMVPSLTSSLKERGVREAVSMFHQQSLATGEFGYGRMKYALQVVGDSSSPNQTIYDVLSDPMMTTPIVDAELATKLRVELERVRAECISLSAAAPARQVPLDPKARQRLRVLGYTALK